MDDEAKDEDSKKYDPEVTNDYTNILWALASKYFVYVFDSNNFPYLP